ncbi:MAG: Maf family protein [Gammaproteobacteria bacterium]|nr:Maf family protein [Gammaproteobacteria bacterium]
MIYLASRSPRRRELLSQIGVEFRTLDVDVDEGARENEAPEALARRLALAKARAGAASLAASDARSPVLGADTVVLLGEAMLGKPRDRAEARDMIMQLSGRSHSVITAVALVVGDEAATRTSETRVWFRPIGAAECDAYCASDEPLDKAGAYAIQGRAAIFVARIDGSYSGVVGLPLYETAELIGQIGVAVPG